MKENYTQKEMDFSSFENEIIEKNKKAAELLPEQMKKELASKETIENEVLDGDVNIDYSFTPKILEDGVIDYTDIEHDKIFLVNKKDILDKERPQWIPELDPIGLKADNYLPVTMQAKDGSYYVQAKFNATQNSNGQTEYETKTYRMALDVLGATVDYYLERQKALNKVKEIKETVSLPRSVKSMSRTRYSGMVELLKVMPDYKENSELTKKYGFGRFSYPTGLLKQKELLFSQYNNLNSKLKSKILDLNFSKSEFIDAHEKGEITSYGDSNLSNGLYSKYGVMIKKQNGSTFSAKEKENLANAIDKNYAHYGDLTELASSYNLKISYAANCRQHASKAIGIFFDFHNAIGVSFLEGKEDESREKPDVILAHEIAHWIDSMKGKDLHYHFASDKEGTLENQIAKKFKDHFLYNVSTHNRNVSDDSKKSKPGDYWSRTCECFARAMEENYAIKNNVAQNIFSEVEYLPKEEFERELQPMVEKLMAENKEKFKILETQKKDDSISDSKEVENEQLEFIKSNLKYALNEVAEPLIPIEFTRENYDKLFPLGRINTPIENVKMGAHQFEKLEIKSHTHLLPAAYEALSNPDTVISETKENMFGGNETSHLYIKTYVMNDKSKAIQSVVVGIENDNISISTHLRDISNAMNKIKTPDQLLFAAAKVGRVIEQHTQKKLEQLMVNPTREFSFVDITEPLNKDYNAKEILSINKLIEQGKIKKMEQAILQEKEMETNTIKGESTLSDFDKAILKYEEGTLPENTILNLGKPGEILQNCGFPVDDRIELSAARLKMKSEQHNHPFLPSDILGLDKALQNPVAVFEYGNAKKSQNIIVNIEKNGKNFLAGVFFNQNRSGFEVSSIRGLVNRENMDWIRWIEQGKMIYGNKEKIQVLAAQQRTNLADVNSKDARTSSDTYYLDSLDSLLQKFGNVNNIYMKDYPEIQQECRERFEVFKVFRNAYQEVESVNITDASFQAAEFYEAIKNNNKEIINEYTTGDDHYEICDAVRKYFYEIEEQKNKSPKEELMPQTDISDVTKFNQESIEDKEINVTETAEEEIEYKQLDEIIEQITNAKYTLKAERNNNNYNVELKDESGEIVFSKKETGNIVMPQEGTEAAWDSKKELHKLAEKYFNILAENEITGKYLNVFEMNEQKTQTIKPIEKEDTSIIKTESAIATSLIEKSGNDQLVMFVTPKDNNDKQFFARGLLKNYDSKGNYNNADNSFILIDEYQEKDFLSKEDVNVVSALAFPEEHYEKQLSEKDFNRYSKLKEEYFSDCISIDEHSEEQNISKELKDALELEETLSKYHAEFDFGKDNYYRRNTPVVESKVDAILNCYNEYIDAAKDYSDDYPKLSKESFTTKVDELFSYADRNDFEPIRKTFRYWITGNNEESLVGLAFVRSWENEHKRILPNLYAISSSENSEAVEELFRRIKECNEGKDATYRFFDSTGNTRFHEFTASENDFNNYREKLLKELPNKLFSAKTEVEDILKTDIKGLEKNQKYISTMPDDLLKYKYKKELVKSKDSATSLLGDYTNIINEEIENTKKGQVRGTFVFYDSDKKELVESLAFMNDKTKTEAFAFDIEKNKYWCEILKNEIEKRPSINIKEIELEIENEKNKEAKTDLNATKESEVISNDKKTVEPPFTILDNKEQNRINIRFDPSHKNPNFTDILKELKHNGWRFSPKNRVWYPIGQAVKDDKEFAQKLLAKYSNENAPDISIVKENEKSLTDGIKFFDINENKASEFVTFFNSTKDEKAKELNLEEAKTILTCLNESSNKETKVGLNANNKLVMFVNNNGNQSLNEVSLDSLITSAFNNASCALDDFKTIDKNLNNGNPFLEDMYDSLKAKTENNLTRMTSIFNTYTDNTKNLSTSLNTLESGSKLGERVVSNVLNLSSGVYQATLSIDTDSELFSGANYFILDNDVAQKCSKSILELTKNYGEQFVVEDKSLEPYVLKELIDKKLCPPRDDSYYQKLSDYIEKHPLKYAKLLPNTIFNFKENLNMLSKIEKNTSDYLILGKKLVSMADKENKSKISEWLIKEGCHNEDSMKKVFESWCGIEQHKKTVKEIPPRASRGE